MRDSTHFVHYCGHRSMRKRQDQPHTPRPAAPRSKRFLPSSISNQAAFVPRYASAAELTTHSGLELHSSRVSTAVVACSTQP